MKEQKSNRALHIPEIIFSQWYPWKNRDHIDHVKSKGVYLLAHFDNGKVPTGNASPLDKHIVYIGETTKRSFLVRLTEFNKSASSGRDGHSGGLTYFKRFKGIKPGLHVAYFPILSSGWSSRQKSFFINYLEGKLIWEFARTYKNEELCNKD